MNQEIVKTVKWSDAKELLSALANKNLGRAKNNKPADFNEFVTAYPTVTQKRMFDFLEGIVLRNSLSDVTSLAVIAEDSCLFSAEAVTAIDIVLRHLKTLNTGGGTKNPCGDIWIRTKKPLSTLSTREAGMRKPISAVRKIFPLSTC